MILTGCLAIAALIVFALMRNSAAKRNDFKREKISEKQEELLTMLKNRDKHNDAGKTGE